MGKADSETKEPEMPSKAEIAGIDLTDPRTLVISAVTIGLLIAALAIYNRVTR